MSDSEQPTPSGGCKTCGEVKITHGLKRGPDGEWHPWQEPGRELRRQRLKLQRQWREHHAQRQNPTEGA